MFLLGVHIRMLYLCYIFFKKAQEHIFFTDKKSLLNPRQQLGTLGWNENDFDIFLLLEFDIVLIKLHFRIKMHLKKI